MKVYEAPELFVDEYVADTMIASSGAKNGNPDNNQNCWGCDSALMANDGKGNICIYYPSDGSKQPDSEYNGYCQYC